MCILTAQSIRDLCREELRLIDPWEESRVKASSYDLSLGSECYLYKRGIKEKRVENMIEQLGIGQVLEIPSREICFVITEEKVNIPVNIVARVSLMTDLIMKGVVITTQPPIDAGYKGRIYVLLHNLSNRVVRLKRGEPILTIEFTKLDSDTEKPYDGRLQNLAALKEQESVKGLSPYMTLFDSGLRELEEELSAERTKARERFQTIMPTLLTVITVTVAILAIIVTGLAVVAAIYGVPWLQEFLSQMKK